MTSTQIRQSFLDFFREKQHSIVPSSSLMPDSPNLLFTNAGMNQFVPIFLGQKSPDVSKWAGALPGSDQRAADTQKCIRAGGKHNDLDDVGLDTYHHTFFEMLGNWSFGDYFKNEAIDWAWELVIGRWKFPAARLYATIYNPEPGDPASRDEEAWNLWAEKFRAAGLDPAVHIVNGNKKDNFWMMGETGPCGPCSELHIDLTPAGDTRGALVNKGTAECIEIWNLVFIQFNANPDGSFTPLPARHVDTGMGFERVASIIQGTKNLTDFANARISNYETDIFRPIFDELEKLSGRTYGSTLPVSGSTGDTEQEKTDVAFRVIADHIRTLSFAIADGIQPGNTDRHYVLRRILRRAVRYGRSLGLHDPFFHKLVDVLARTMGEVFPELRAKQKHIEQVLKLEEETFNRTLDKGITLFNEEAGKGNISAAFAFKLYDEQGFPLDLTELMARERGITVDTAGFEKLMEAQRARARAAQKKEVIALSEIETTTPTRFTGYDSLTEKARVLEVVSIKNKTAVILDTTPCYAEMGGQIGDTAEITGHGQLWRVTNTQKTGHTFLHLSIPPTPPRSAMKSKSPSPARAATRSSATTPSPTFSTGRSTKSSPRTPRKKARPSRPTNSRSTSTAPRSPRSKSATSKPSSTSASSPTPPSRGPKSPTPKSAAAPTSCNSSATNTATPSASSKSAARPPNSTATRWNSAPARTPAPPARSASSASSPKPPSPPESVVSKPSPALKPALSLSRNPSASTTSRAS
jgi:alanyl-tRNA synthetase